MRRGSLRRRAPDRGIAGALRLAVDARRLPGSCDLDLDRQTHGIESATALAHVRETIKPGLARLYGPRLDHVISENPR